VTPTRRSDLGQSFVARNAPIHASIDQLIEMVGTFDGPFSCGAASDTLRLGEVGARAGVQVFADITDLAAPLGAPSYRVPGIGNFGTAVVVDVDCDGASEIVSVRANTATVWRAIAGTLVAARTITPAITVTARDSDGDGDGDLVVTTDGHSDFYPGCAPPVPGCDGGLESAPAWGIDQPVLAMVPDLDHDGLDEALLTDPPFGASGRRWLHLSDPVTGIAAAATWSTLGDPNYPVLGRQVVVPGDLDGDHKGTEFIVGSAGRVYAFFPRPNQLAQLAPGFAWPHDNAIQDQLIAGEPVFGNSMPAIAAGPLDRDTYADLVIAAVTITSRTSRATSCSTPAAPRSRSAASKASSSSTSHRTAATASPRASSSRINGSRPGGRMSTYRHCRASGSTSPTCPTGRTRSRSAPTRAASSIKTTCCRTPPQSAS
jgi:hypothetical protein